MRELYKKIAALTEDEPAKLVTVLTGPDQGLKYLTVGGRIAAVSDGYSLADAERYLREETNCPAHESGAAARPERGEGTRQEDAESGAEIFREDLSHRDTLVVCGAGYVGQAVLTLGHFIGFHTLSIDDREEFGQAALEKGADEFVCGKFDQILKAEDKFRYDQSTYFVVVTREHQYDRACLHEILRHECAYVGMMGSRKRTALMRESLLEMGYAAEKIESIHAPIGLKIGAQTPEEIAVSIIAEIIGTKRNGHRAQAFDMEVLSAILESEEPAVLCTIAERKGSTPRDAGTKMLVRTDALTGTIGGGVMEAAVIRRAKELLTAEETRCELMRVDLTGRSGEYSDMACGGVTDIFLERV